ncbi:alpha/beta hydrolase [Ilumatobacter sp.]|uniref:alpha/beta hydrolase n=1 Tax=Ilumatobacter sp. TaxID=1967498 RepID=UPI003C34BE32
MEPWTRNLAGRVEESWFDSDALNGNPLGDPARRPVWVYLPPGYDDCDERYTSIYLIQGMGGQVDMWRNRSPMRPNVIELIDETFSDPNLAPCVVVMVDCWTSLGGSQYVDSPGTGRYHTYLCDEIVPWVDATYRTVPEAARRGITGKSSGGYGAMITPMLRPDLFGGLATHAGDAQFEGCFQPDFRESARALRSYDGSFDAYWDDVRSRPAMTKAEDMTLINIWCMAACWSTDADGTVRLPFDTRTGAVDDHVWARWLAWDPVRMVPGHADALRGLSALYVDAGERDEYYLDLGAQGFVDALKTIGVEPTYFELFDAGHMAIEYRYPIALRHLAERLGP